jgi:hypothetical protein
MKMKIKLNSELATGGWGQTKCRPQLPSVIPLGIIVLLIFCSHPQLALAQIHDDEAIELSGYSVSETYQIEDEQALDSDSQHFRRLLYRIKQTSPDNLEKYSRFSHEVTLQQATQSIADYRLWVFDRQGTVTSFSRYKLADTEADEAIRSYYVSDCTAPDGETFQVVSLAIPSDWNKTESLKQPIRFAGFLYSLVDGVPLFIADHIQWYPESANADLGITESAVLLAKHGVDIGQLDNIRRQNSKPMGATDAAVFFQTLIAVETIPIEPEVARLTFREIMSQPKQNLLQAVSFQARVKKCSIVQLPPESAARRGFEKYYQLMVFPDIDGQIVVSNPGGEDLVYRRFPVTVCARELPEGVTAAELENQQVEVSGFYFRFWKYSAEMTEAAGASGQPSPIVISRVPILLISDDRSLSTFLTSILGGIFVVLAIAWWFLRKSPKRTGAEEIYLPDQMDTSGLE